MEPVENGLTEGLRAVPCCGIWGAECLRAEQTASLALLAHQDRASCGMLGSGEWARRGSNRHILFPRF